MIGVDGALPWHLPGDLARFKRLTMGGVLVMGRSTHESIGRPLPGRRTIVLSRNPCYVADGVDVVSDLGAALALATATGTPVAVVGGGAVYSAALPHVGRIEMTVVDVAPDGDTRFPALDADRWRCIRHEDGEGEPAHRFHTLVATASGDLGCLPASLVSPRSATQPRTTGILDV